MKINNLIDVLYYILVIINRYLIPTFFGLAFIAFLWGLLKLMMSVGDEAKRKEAKNIITFGIIALFVMVSVWGLVNFLGQSLLLDSGFNSPTHKTINNYTNINNSWIYGSGSF